MRFFKSFIRNLVLLLVMGLVLFLLFPNIMGPVFHFSGLILGPLAILVIIVAALPLGRRY